MTGADLVLLLVSWLATLRLYRLLVWDDITQGFRDRLTLFYYWVAGEGVGLRGRFWDAMYKGATCPYCLWFWAGLGVVWTGLVWGDTLYWQVPMMALALNHLVGDTISRTDR